MLSMKHDGPAEHILQPRMNESDGACGPHLSSKHHHVELAPV